MTSPNLLMADLILGNEHPGLWYGLWRGARAERYTWQDKRVWFDVIVKSWCLDRKAGREPQHLKIDIYHVVLCKRT